MLFQFYDGVDPEAAIVQKTKADAKAFNAQK